MDWPLPMLWSPASPQYRPPTLPILVRLGAPAPPPTLGACVSSWDWPAREFHATPPGTPRHQPSTPDPLPQARCPSLDNLAVPESPGEGEGKAAEPLLSPLPLGESRKALEVKKEELGGSSRAMGPQTWALLTLPPQAPTWVAWS